MSATATTRTRRLVVLAIVLAVSVVGVRPSAASAATDPNAAEDEFLLLLNNQRAESHLPLLARDRGLDTVARDWSGTMRTQDHLHHRPNLTAAVDAGVTSAWTRLGENVGVGGSVERLHRAFMNSPGHRANVVGDYNRVGIGVVTEADGTIWVTFVFLKGEAIVGSTASAIPPAGNLWLVGPDGSVRSYGTAKFQGSLTGDRLSAPIVAAAATGTGRGYWLLGADGGIFSFGDAKFLGSTGNIRLNQPIVGMAPTPTGHGYWLVARDGGIFAFGDARFFGSTGNIRLNQPIVGMAPAPSGRGYWLVAADGGLFSFGDAAFFGSVAGHSRGPVAGMASTPTGRGYWIAGADGAVYTFGDARFHGAATGRTPSPIVALAVTSDGAGYRLVARDGRVFPFGETGATVSSPVGGSVVAIAAVR